jgi:hypothetical protein
MGNTMRREYVEIHMSTGKLEGVGLWHMPQWGEWQSDPPGPRVRSCQYETLGVRFACDLQDFEGRPSTPTPNSIEAVGVVECARLVLNNYWELKELDQELVDALDAALGLYDDKYTVPDHG